MYEFISYVRGNGLEPKCSLLPAIANHPLGYGLRSGSTSQSRPRANTDHLGIPTDTRRDLGTNVHAC